MSNEKNIFDFNNLPEELKKIITRKKRISTSSKVLDLFKIKNKLTLDEIVVGMFNHYNIIKTKQQISNALVGLIKCKKIIKVKSKRGIYKLKKEK